MDIRFTLDGESLLFASQSGLLNLCPLQSKILKHTWNPLPESLAIDTLHVVNSTTVLVGSERGASVALFDVENGTVLHQVHFDEPVLEETQTDEDPSIGPFNVLDYYAPSSLLFVGNSARASLFALHIAPSANLFDNIVTTLSQRCFNCSSLDMFLGLR